MGRRGTKKMNVTKDKGKQVEELHDKNPVKPMRPPTDFIAYRIDFARKQKAKGKALTIQELNIASRNAWNKLPDEEKLVWKNEKDMKKYKELMKSYKESIADRGESIKSDVPKQAYRFRCTPAKFLRFVGRIDGEKIAAIQEIGFGGLLEIECHNLPSMICMWLVNNFNPTHSYIQLEGGRVLPVTSEDIAKALGIPGEGPVPVEDTGNDGIDSEPHYPRKKKYNWHDIEDELISMEVGDEFKRLFVIFACGCLLAPTTRAEIKANLWESLQSTSEIAKFNWAEFVRADLCKKLLNMQSNAQKNAGGCILFLLLHYYDRVSILNHCVRRTCPIAKAWTDANIMERETLELGGLGKFGKGKLVGSNKTNREEKEEEEPTELPPDVISQMVNNGHGEIAVHLAILYTKAATAERIAIECQQSVMNISSILCSHRSAMPSCSQTAVRSTRKWAKKRMIDDEKAKVVIDCDTDKFEYENNQDETCVGDRNEDFGENEASEPEDREGKDDAKAIAEVHCLDAGLTSPSGATVEQHSLCAATQWKGRSRYKKRECEDAEDGRMHKTLRTTRHNTLIRSTDYQLQIQATLTQCSRKIANFTWQDAGDESEILVSMFEFSLNRRDMQSLREKHWVSDRVIDMYARLLNNDASKRLMKVKRYIVEPCVVAAIQGVGRFEKKSDDVLYSKLNKWFKIRADNASSLANADMILVPVVNKSHWFVYSFDITQSIVHLLDSRVDSSRVRQTNILRRLKRTLGLIMAKQFDKLVDFEGFVLQVADVPQQSPHNSYDCGVFIMKFLEHWNGRLGIRITEDNMWKYRVQYVSMLVATEHNEWAESILELLNIPPRRKSQL